MTSRPEHVIVDELDPDNSPLPIPELTPRDISETLIDAKDAHTGWTLGGSVLGEYLPLPKGTGPVIGGAIGYGISKLKRKTFQRISSQVDNWLSSKDFSLFNKDVKVNSSNPLDTLKVAATGGLDVGTARDVSGNIAKGADYSDFGWVKGLEDLDPTGPTPIRAKGETKRKLASQHTTGVEVTPQIYKIFKESSSNALEAYQFKLGIKVGNVEDHHKGIIRQIFEATNGLLPHARKKGSDFISKNLGFELGYSGRNAVPLPTKFHPRIHALINKRIGEGGYLGGYNLRGIEKKLNLPPDWQSTFTHRQRIPIYKELVSTIGDSVKQIDVFWDSLVSRTNLGSLSKEEYLETVLDVIDLDKRLLDVQNPSVMSSLGKGGTATEIINEILTKAGKIDMTSPIFKSLDKNLSKEALKLAIQENGYKALWEVIVSGQTPATVFKAYGIKPSNKLINAIKKDNAAYQHMLRSRGKNIPPADSVWNLGQDN